MMWPFGSNNKLATENGDDESVYTEEEYEEHYEYEVEVTDDEAEDDDDDSSGVMVETADGVPPVVEALVVTGEEAIEDVEEEDEAPVHEMKNTEEKETNVSVITKDDDEEYVESDDDDDDEQFAPESGHEQESSEDESEDEDEHEDEEDDEPEDTVTSMEEKHSLLALAAEHDRVDILQSIVSPEDKQILLNNPAAPPLHVAISFGSTNATTCLLRLGANPALRPVTEHKKINGRTAWELAFGGTLAPPDDAAAAAAVEKDKKKQIASAGWFTPTKKNTIKPIDMAPSKREGIRHAFTAEALRSIGADDVARLSQLLDSGMPSDIDIGGNKDIVGWCREMGAVECLKALVVEEELVDEAPTAEAVEGLEETVSVPSQEGTTVTAVATTATTKTPINTENSSVASTPSVRRSSDVNDPESLHNRLEELHTLAVGLSTYLDNLAEEVSVCHGLLLMGNGASALASHVRSLREQQEFLRNDLDDRTVLWESTEEDLGAYTRRYKVKGGDSTALFREITNKSNASSAKSSFSRRLSTDDPVQLRAQLGASENKIRKLRASIADMSDESETAMKEVEKRGLTGGIKLVRKLREQIRELDFQASEAKSGEALCRAKLQQLQQQMRVEQEQQQQGRDKSKELVVAESVPQSPSNGDTVDAGVKSDYVSHQQRSLTIDLSSSKHSNAALASIAESPPRKSQDLWSLADPASTNGQTAAAPLSSASISTGQSQALMKYNAQGRGYMPVNLWHILLRIIGLGREAVKHNVQELKKQSSTVMIV